MILKLNIKTTYGTPRFYPVNDTAKAVCKLTGTATLTEKHIKVLKNIGFSVELEMNPAIERLIGRIVK